ncbi:MAG: hypothetical protein U0166_25825 [Acidobacteriota bacterium]
MQKITPDSLRELNSQLDPTELLRDIGIRKVETRGEKVVADCPLEPGVKGVLSVEPGPNFVQCSSQTCAAAQRRSLLWLYCKATGVSLQDGAQALASQTGVLLEYEGEGPPLEPPPPKVIDLVEAPPMIGAVESASIRGEKRYTEVVSDGPKPTCPLLKEPCLEDGCRWWVVDWIEERNLYRKNCAVSLIAIGLTEETKTGKKK